MEFVFNVVHCVVCIIVQFYAIFQFMARQIWSCLIIPFYFKLILLIFICMFLFMYVQFVFLLILDHSICGKHLDDFVYLFILLELEPNFAWYLTYYRVGLGAI